VNGSFARQLRLRRLYRHGDDRLLIVPLDHSVTDGPVTGGRRVDGLIGTLAGNGVDGVVVHKGVLRYVDPLWFTSTSLVVHLSASTVNAPDPDAKYLVATVEEAVRLGADAVSVHVNVGSRQEARQIADLSAVGEACERWNIPLLAMMYARGPAITDPYRPDLLAHAVILAADLGADIVKTVYPGSVEGLRLVTRDSPVPVIVAGGPQRRPDELASYLDDVLRGGAAGVAMGRNVFAANDPGAVAAALATRIHPTYAPLEVAAR
jgi:2-amino-4,5-dihydroxy-6-oxo-7-(phosphonooxy)heptanoate synthase